MAGAGLATGSSMHRLAWWGAAIGIGIAIADTLTLGWLGASFEMAGRDVTWLVMAWFGCSFAVVGFLLGDAIETRRRERAAAAALDAARARVAQSEKLAALGQLAAAIAHEVRNPLAVVRSAAQGLGETLPADDTDGHRAASFIVTEVDRLASVVRALLDFARPVELERRPTEIAGVIDRAVALAGRDLAAKHLRLERDEAAPLPPVQADGDLVCQVLVGLLGNAAAATPAGGRVVVTHAGGERHGRARRRGQRARHRPAGSGEGLRAVLHHARGRHRARPRGRPADRRGARRPHRRRRRRGRRRALHGAVAGGRGVTARVLVVDDEPRVAEMIAAALGRAGHACEVVHVRRGRAGGARRARGRRRGDRLEDARAWTASS